MTEQQQAPDTNRPDSTSPTASPRWLHRRLPMIAVSLVLLAFIGAESWSRPSPADAAPYHAEIRRVADAIPMDIAGWEGTDREVPPSAVKMLRPNVVLSRSYQHQRTGMYASVLVVQCKDAADLVGHYPPRCYPSQGWKPVSAKPQDWRIDGRDLPGMAYEYAAMSEGTEIPVHVANLLMLPDGSLSRDMSDVAGVAADYTRYIYGAAQLQVLTYGDLTESDRNAVLADLLPAFFPLMDAIGSGEVAKDMNASNDANDANGVQRP